MDGCEHWFDAMVEFDWDDVNNTITNIVVDDAGFVTQCHVGLPSTGYARIYLTFDGTTAHVTSLSIDNTGNPVYDDKISDPSWIQEVIDGMNDEIDAQK